MRACLNADEVLDFLGHKAEAAGGDELHSHVAECEECAALVAVALRTSGDVVASIASGQAQAGIRIGRYQVEELIGCGGHGAVYRCVDPTLARTVALKVQRVDADRSPEVAARLRGRMLEEGRSMARFHHPNVVPVFDVGTFEGQVYLVMELVDGTTLRQRIKADVDWLGVVALFLDAGRGLAAAHAAGLVHRDFKPENVLIGRDGAVKVSDFGLALAAEDAANGGSVAGTPGYMAPEQHSGHHGDARSDQFSFCVALYEALYRRRRPYAGRVTLDSTVQVAPIPDGSRVPAWVHRVLLRGLSIRPEERFPTLADLLRTLSETPVSRRRRVRAFAEALALVAAAGAGFALGKGF